MHSPYCIFLSASNLVYLFLFSFCLFAASLFILFYKSYSMHFTLYILFFASHHEHLIMCILYHVLILCFSFSTFNFMHLILYISFYTYISMHFVLFLTFELLLKLVGDRRTNRRTDIVTYRAAIGAKNDYFDVS
jgi:hypothetical protein